MRRENERREHDQKDSTSWKEVKCVIGIGMGGCKQKLVPDVGIFRKHHDLMLWGEYTKEENTEHKFYGTKSEMEAENAVA